MVDGTSTANIGLRTGLSFDVVDLDGEAAVDALEDARAGREPPQGPVVQTGHGFHWYVKPTRVGNRADVLPGVDFRGEGGYVLGPPSVHPKGHRYRWINPLREAVVVSILVSVALVLPCSPRGRGWPLRSLRTARTLVNSGEGDLEAVGFTPSRARSRILRSPAQVERVTVALRLR